MTTCEILCVVCEHLCWVCTKPDLAVTYDPNGIYPQKSQALPFRLYRLSYIAEFKEHHVLKWLNPELQREASPQGHAGLPAKHTQSECW